MRCGLRLTEVKAWFDGVRPGEVFAEPEPLQHLPYTRPNPDASTDFRKFCGGFVDVDIDVGVF
jgi:hypothetical protein